MHVLFVHQQYPAQFGHVARRLVADCGWHCTFLTRAPARNDAGVRVVRYGAKTEPAPASHPYVRHFEADVRQAEAVHAYCRNTRLRPDLVGHSGFGSTIFLRELFDCPIVNYFEYFYRTKDSDFDFRPDVPTTPEDAMRARARNAMTLLDLANCDAGYTPTAWQRGLFPAELRRKIRVIPDGIDTELWRRRPATRRFGGRPIAAESKIVTYVARGLESMRGFGVAGNRRCRPDQPGWAFVDDRFTWDARRNLSGAVAHGSRPSGVVTRYGRAPAACELLDGVLLAARRETLARSGVRFDPLFPFHFYDLDFCRSARARGLALGTWPIAITHASGGAFGSPAWRRARDRYRGKWQEPRLVSGDA